MKKPKKMSTLQSDLGKYASGAVVIGTLIVGIIALIAFLVSGIGLLLTVAFVALLVCAAVFGNLDIIVGSAVLGGFLKGFSATLALFADSLISYGASAQFFKVVDQTSYTAVIVAIFVVLFALRMIRMAVWRGSTAPVQKSKTEEVPKSVEVKDKDEDEDEDED